MDDVLLAMGAVPVSTWILPATALTLHLDEAEGIQDDTKRLLRRIAWRLPVFGCCFCMLVLARPGKIKQLSDNEQRTVWAASSSLRNK